ncbi:MAG TPA: mechanosensitive ion channel domain-containing protein [Prolixibacteraceae bacterium]|nr:mechanosensitive ion channel domain-containing protein [Prolixibacteraceae bacterium]
MEELEVYYRVQIIQTVIVLALLVVIRFITRNSINRALKKFNFSIQRRRMTVKILNFFLLISVVFILLGIWGIDKERLILFISSVLTIIGVAFVAQWSILSNITAAFILFFNHPMKIGDQIKVLEKDFVIEGVIDDITSFFVHIKTLDGERITIPNTVILQKNISIKYVENKHLKSSKVK